MEDYELTRKIGFLTATASEDWTLVLDVCDQAGSSESNAKEAVRALRREFKYGEPAAQLAAARLWAIMLRNSSDTFISQSTSRKFIDTLEGLLTSARTSPVVRERVMDVLAAAAYANGTKKNTGFRGLWRRVKPRDKPEEGMPFDDTLCSGLPVPTMRLYEYHECIIPPDEDMRRLLQECKIGNDRKRLTRNRIISPDEDMRRLFQECKLGSGNAALLSQALVMAAPEDLVRVDIKESYTKCRASQELIFAQIPWASAGAERSRVAKDLEEKELQRMRKNGGVSNGNTTPAEPLSTREEDLLMALLAANAELIEALQLYHDLERAAIDREAEVQSRGEVWVDIT
ncbi:hypothetical protein C8J57DRAFT_1480333 [Mycena rebaudengoi]|nr:hypothetical protein C8J57DRAFT_1480333 [Mycena rebaudengoi]